MAIPVLMPRQGQSVETCILGEWYKKKGDTIKVGDLLFSYETDKASFEEDAKTDGILLEVFYAEGDEVPVLVNVAVIGNAGESVEEFRPEGANSISIDSEINASEEQNEETIELPVAHADNSTSTKIKISPRARNAAEKLGLAYDQIRGTGPEGRIIERDIEAASLAMPRLTPLAKEKAKAENLKAVESATGLGGRAIANDLIAANQVYSDDFEVKKLSNMRKLIAKAMHTSLQNSAQLTHHMSADARKIMALRKRFKKELDAGAIIQNITINDLVCFAVIKALKKFPQVNTHFLGDSMRWFKKVHLGLAVDTDRGLMVPAVKNADDLSLEGLSAQLNAIAAQCRKGNVSPELLAPEAATFTISNLGNYGVEMFTPVINIPQTAILGVCAIIPRPKDLGDGVYGFVPMMGLSLTYDHQALDGGEATLFLKEIKEQIENLEV